MQQFTADSLLNPRVFPFDKATLISVISTSFNVFDKNTLKFAKMKLHLENMLSNEYHLFEVDESFQMNFSKCRPIAGV